MKQTTMLAAAGAVAAIAAIAGGVYYLTRPNPPRIARVAPLPANLPRYGNWTMIGCRNGAQRCTLLTRVVNRQNTRVVLQVNVLRAQNGNPLLLVTLPPNIIVPAGITLTPAGGTAAKGNIRACRPQACSAVVLLTDPLIKELSGANATGLQFVAATGRRVNLNLATGGFDRAFAAWRSALPPLPAQTKTKTAVPEPATAAEPRPAQATGAGAKPAVRPAAAAAASTPAPGQPAR